MRKGLDHSHHGGCKEALEAAAPQRLAARLSRLKHFDVHTLRELRGAVTTIVVGVRRRQWWARASISEQVLPTLAIQQEVPGG